MPVANAGRKATLVLVSNLAGAALGYGSLLLVGRYFAPASYGAYLFALSLTGLVALASNLGLGIAHQRHIAQGTAPGDGLGVLVRLRVSVSASLLAVAAVGYFGWSLLRGRTLTDATTPAVLGVALAVQILSGARQTFFDTWQGQQRVHRIEGLKTLDTLLVLVLLGNAALLVAHLQGRWEIVPAIGAFWAHHLGLHAPLDLEQGALLLAACYLIAKGLSMAAALAWWATDDVRIGPWDRALARSYLRFALPLALMGVLGLVLQYTDSVLLGFFWTAREVGLYGAAQRLSTLCLLGSVAVGTVLFPRFAALQAAGDHAGEASTFARAERYLLLLALPVAAAMLTLPGPGLHIAVGDAYLDAAGPLRWLALWAVLGALAQPIGSRLMGGGHTAIMLRCALLNAGGNVLFNLILIPPHGLGLGPTGAALATFLSTLLAYVYLRWKGRALYALPWVSAAQLSILAAGGLCGGFWWAAWHYVGPAAFDRFWELGAWGLAGGLLYAAALASLGELHRSDLAFLRKVAHPGELLAEMRGR